MEHIKKFERSIINIIIRILYKYNTILSESEITYSDPEIEILKTPLKDYESEFRVVFYLKKKFYNIVECHIFRKGRKLASAEEFESWFEKAIVEIVEKTNRNMDL